MHTAGHARARALRLHNGTIRLLSERPLTLHAWTSRSKSSRTSLWSLLRTRQVFDIDAPLPLSCTCEPSILPFDQCIAVYIELKSIVHIQQQCLRLSTAIDRYGEMITVTSSGSESSRVTNWTSPNPSFNHNLRLRQVSGISLINLTSHCFPYVAKIIPRQLPNNNSVKCFQRPRLYNWWQCVLTY